LLRYNAAVQPRLWSPVASLIEAETRKSLSSQ
jgi:hypothetical protein